MKYDNMTTDQRSVWLDHKVTCFKLTVINCIVYAYLYTFL